MSDACEHAFDSTVDFQCADGIGSAEKIIKSGGIDVVILDLTLTDSTRDATISRLPEFVRKWNLPIYIITGDPSMETRDKCLSLAASGTIDYSYKNDVIPVPTTTMERLYNMTVKHRAKIKATTNE